MAVGVLVPTFLALMSGVTVVFSQESAACSEVMSVSNGAARCRSQNGATICTVVCNSGYAVIGSSVFTCTSGGWSDEIPSCQAVEQTGRCATLTELPGGRLVGSCTAASSGDMCQLVCISGYRPSDTRVLVCQPNGAWSDTLPTCIAVEQTGRCATLTAPPGGRLVGTCTAASSGDTCQLVCISGYRPSDTRVLVCQPNSAWSDTLPTCIGSQCPAIVSSDGRTTTGSCSPGAVGQICTISCQPGYTLTGGPSVVTCLENGVWSGNIATCSRQTTCPSLRPPSNGQMYGDCDPGSAGDSCFFACDTAYRLVGQRQLTCNSDGSWSSSVPSCQAQSCPPLRAPSNGQMYGQCEPGQAGQTCSFICNSGYRLVGQSQLTCNSDSSWSSPVPTCSGASCPALRPPTNGQMYGQCDRSSAGQTCSFVCNSGYRLVGQSQLTCNSDGSWSGSVPTCAGASCPALRPPTNGQMYGQCDRSSAGQTCSFVCNSGYRLVGQSQLTCNSDGSWSGPVPTCEGQNCPALQSISNGQMYGQCNPGIAGQSCTFLCNSGYTLNGQWQLTCNSDGTWSSSRPSCTAIATCPRLPAPNNGAISGSCTSGNVGDTCTFSCQSGYTLVGQATLVCQPGGTWSSSAPTCSSAVSCPNLYSPEHGYMLGTCSPGQSGRTCTFGCESGYKLEGSSTLTCQASGLWSSDPPTCERGSASQCPSLTAPPNAEFIECDNRIGGRCVVVCQRGYVRAGSRVRTCLAQGTWSGFAPTCSKRVGYR